MKIVDITKKSSRQEFSFIKNETSTYLTDFFGENTNEEGSSGAVLNE